MKAQLKAMLEGQRQTVMSKINSGQIALPEEEKTTLNVSESDMKEIIGAVMIGDSMSITKIVSAAVNKKVDRFILQGMETTFAEFKGECSV